MIRAALLALFLTGPAFAAGSAEPLEDEEETQASPEGAAKPPYALLPPEHLNAFPPEVLARMRAALVALEAARDGE